MVYSKIGINVELVSDRCNPPVVSSLLPTTLPSKDMTSQREALQLNACMGKCLILVNAI